MVFILRSYDEISGDLLRARYLLPGESGYCDMCRRVAGYIGACDEEKNEFEEIMLSKKFLPNSPTLMNAGSGKGQLSACFVLPVGDSIREIFETLKNSAIIHKSGGGTGFNFSSIRPSGSQAGFPGGKASGPVSFIKIFDSATGVIKQGGRRRGANIGILDVDHPDIIPFINSKRAEGRLRNFNISVMADDSFMRSPDDGILEIIAGNIIRNGEPGILFRDTVNRKNKVPGLGVIDAVNPCGEEPLLPFESCNLGSLNLSEFVSSGEFRYDLLKKSVRTAVCFLDNVIDKNRYPLKEIEDATLKTRKIGLGVMGFHDMLIKLGIPYESPGALQAAGGIMSLIESESVGESRIIAEEKGAFPAIGGSIWEFPVRNATTTAIAPTGSISLIAGCSSGIEPLFGLAYLRRHLASREYFIVHPLFSKALDSGFLKDKSGIISEAYSKGSISGLESLPEDFRALFKVADEIGWKAHIDMQAVFQDHVHAAVSKTVMLPEHSGTDDVIDAIYYGWRKGLKGLTFYRNKSRRDAVMTTGDGCVILPCRSGFCA
ncbi:ribonucleotide reductase N-terminal alpha domain-containing protein [Methanoplanus limicola]|uniref:Ribonucleoside-diphosphate reductase n=1 Tax=Methanoplanus limicola DSM 2279 TaxID=937775 RepID=H1YYU3_9EURY|nr:ribonucleotide reductase N-terminal alpha domain-containing protein [Methanoplanus limicola]EHQ37015.1 ribonucleoside-diphosphate reductase, adenosylcobalamin-dependent [Methanoplanus limicola DSM 2279]